MSIAAKWFSFSLAFFLGLSSSIAMGQTNVYHTPLGAGGCLVENNSGPYTCNFWAAYDGNANPYTGQCSGPLGRVAIEGTPCGNFLLPRNWGTELRNVTFAQSGFGPDEVFWTVCWSEGPCIETFDENLGSICAGDIANSTDHYYADIVINYDTHCITQEPQ